MSGEDSAFAALGLRPGAGRTEVNEAYRRLIKIHHPDRSGGDGRRAAEINRAYTLLTRNRTLAPRRPRSPPVPTQPSRRSANPRRRAWLFGLAAVALMVAGYSTVEVNGTRRAMAVPVVWHDPAVEAAVPAQANFDEPLETVVMNRAIAEATAYYAAGDWASAAHYSRDCRDKIRQAPNLPLFDACSAFDEAMLMLDRDSSGVPAGFSGSAVVLREVASARAFGGDTSGADSRLHRIRSHVELALLPLLDPAAGELEP